MHKEEGGNEGRAAHELPELVIVEGGGRHSVDKVVFEETVGVAWVDLDFVKVVVDLSFIEH